MAKGKARIDEIFVDQVGTLLKLDPRNAPVAEIAQAASARDNDRRRLLVLANKMLKSPTVRRSDDARIVGVKLMLALLPDTGGSIKAWLANRSASRFAEVHFSIFCFLPEAIPIRKAAQFIATMPELAEHYLRDTRVDTGMAAWMAGEMLGEHWAVSASTPALLDSAKSARFTRGRLAALHGIAHLWSRSSKEARKLLSRELLAIKLSDPSHRVRNYIERMLDGRNVCALR